MGFRVNPNCQAVDGEGIAPHLEHWRDVRHQLDYETDGVVIKVAEREMQEGRGSIVTALARRRTP